MKPEIFLMKEYQKILHYENGVSQFTPYSNAIGEIMLYDGSFRLALSKEVWEKMEKIVCDLITQRLDEDWNKRHQYENHVKDFNSYNTVSRKCE